MLEEQHAFFCHSFILGGGRAPNVIVIDVSVVNLMKIMQIVSIQVKVTQFVC